MNHPQMITDPHAILSYFPVTPKAAWRRYLDVVRAASPDGYAETEEAAWEDLQASLARARNRPAGAA
jgi:hypothetical protein